ncbi:hypothetical protein HYU21_01485 [Candidatus Woesearchaeota archaeon]|nr:hypothetical protein [Candidatus Woesearchaeota archaeon]
MAMSNRLIKNHLLTSKESISIKESIRSFYGSGKEKIVIATASKEIMEKIISNLLFSTIHLCRSDWFAENASSSKYKLGKSYSKTVEKKTNER